MKGRVTWILLLLFFLATITIIVLRPVSVNETRLKVRQPLPAGQVTPLLLSFKFKPSIDWTPYRLWELPRETKLAKDP